MSPKASGDPIPLSRPSLGVEEERACVRVLRSGTLSQGPEAEALEDEFARRVGAAHAVAVSSGTAALQLALLTLGVGPGDEVVVPAYTFIATANAVNSTGAQVVLADVEEDSLNLDPAALAAVRGPGTRAVVPVHLYGLPADMEAIRAAAAGAALVEDAACAAGAETAVGPVGSCGLMTCFSFHPRKVITTGEGGMVTTGDAGLASRLRSARQHGQGQEGVLEPGYNFRMSELAAAVGRVQLRKLDELLARRRQVAGWYRDRLGEVAWLRLPDRGDPAGHIYQSFVMRIRDGAPVSREALLEGLRERGIGCQAGVKPIHFHEPYRSAARGPLPVSEQAGRDAMFLPMYSGLTESQVERVCSAIRQIAGC